MDGNRSSKTDITTVKDVFYDSDFYLQAYIYQILQRYSELVVFPIIGIVGLVGNVLSAVIMVKDGLEIPSNILLLGLAVADFLLLLQTVNVPHLMMYTHPINEFWVMDLKSIIICYNLSMTIYFISVVTFGMSTSLTVFITLERVVAVYLPLKFPSLVTPKRATFAVFFSFFMAMPTAIFTQLKYRLLTYYYERVDQWFGTTIVRNSWIGSGVDFFLKITNSFLAPIAPAIIVSIGCVLIEVKVTITMQRRKRLTTSTKKKGSSARTRTLFMVSFVFFVTRACALFSFLPQVQISNDGFTVNHFMSHLFVLFTNLLILLNSSCNVFIYAVFNPKFRKLLKHQVLFFAKLKERQ